MAIYVVCFKATPTDDLTDVVVSAVSPEDSLNKFREIWCSLLRPYFLDCDFPFFVCTSRLELVQRCAEVPDA